MKTVQSIILASGSPRRKALLEKTGLEFKVIKSDFKENFDPQSNPHEIVKKLSLEKAKAVYKKFEDSIIIAADTVVACDGTILGKPNNELDARNMLKFLSGKTNSLITGFTIIDGKTGKIITKSEETKIWMKKLSAQAIETYIATKEPLDKAGAYAVQGEGSALIEKIEGDFDNAVGLPIRILLKELKKLGVEVL